MKKWLIIEGSSAENVLMATPLLRCVQKAYPGSVYFLTNSIFDKYVRDNRNINHLYFFSDHIRQLIADFNLQQFDGIIDLQNNEQSHIIANEVNAPRIEVKHGFIERLKAMFFPRQSSLMQIFGLAGQIGVGYDGEGVGFVLPKNVHISENDLPTSHQAGFISIVMPASRRQEQTFAIEKLQALCKAIDHPVVLLGDWEDSANASYISKSIDDIKIYNACGKFNFEETCHLIEQSKVVVGQQNALMLISIALRKKIVCLTEGKKQAWDLPALYDELFLCQQKKRPFVVNNSSISVSNMESVAAQVLGLL